jgi:hypothetical protein
MTAINRVTMLYIVLQERAINRTLTNYEFRSSPLPLRSNGKNSISEYRKRHKPAAESPPIEAVGETEPQSTGCSTRPSDIFKQKPFRRARKRRPKSRSTGRSDPPCPKGAPC